MKLFQVVQTNFAFLGVSSNQARLNGNVVATCLLYGLSVTSSAIFLFFEANSFIEYTSNIYVTTALGVISTYFTIWIIKLEKFFILIDNLENFFEKSECFTFERRMNIKLVSICKIFQNVNTQHQKQSMTKLID